MGAVRVVLLALALSACRGAPTPATPLPTAPASAAAACPSDPRFVEWPAAADPGDAARRARELARGDAVIAVCFDVAALPDVVTCVFDSPRMMNFALGRASVFVETTRGLLSPVGASGDLSIQTGAGYDLRGADLARFRAARAAAPAALPPPPGPDADLAAMEAAFDEGFLACRLARRPDLVLLGVPANEEYFAPALAHELLHAQFFTDARYREVVRAHWATLPERQRRAFQLLLAGGYDIGDDELMANELAAYVLMRPRLWTVPLFDEVEGTLRAALAAAGVQPVDVWGATSP